ncbi:hypothetical protein C9890_0470, partial [Perkinsus sp. BL_2016]
PGNALVQGPVRPHESPRNTPRRPFLRAVCAIAFRPSDWTRGRSFRRRRSSERRKRRLGDSLLGIN